MKLAAFVDGNLETVETTTFDFGNKNIYNPQGDLVTKEELVEGTTYTINSQVKGNMKLAAFVDGNLESVDTESFDFGNKNIYNPQGDLVSKEDLVEGVTYTINSQVKGNK